MLGTKRALSVGHRNDLVFFSADGRTGSDFPFGIVGIVFTKEENVPLVVLYVVVVRGERGVVCDGSQQNLVG